MHGNIYIYIPRWRMFLKMKVVECFDLNNIYFSFNTYIHLSIQNVFHIFLKLNELKKIIKVKDFLDKI